MRGIIIQPIHAMFFSNSKYIRKGLVHHHFLSKSSAAEFQCVLVSKRKLHIVAQEKRYMHRTYSAHDIAELNRLPF